MRNYLILLFAAALTGCSGVKNLRQPEIVVPESYTSHTAPDTAWTADMAWVEFYGDTTLCGFIKETLANNKDLLTAAARVEELSQLYGVEKASMLPVLGLNVYAQDETNDYSGTGISHDRELGVKLPISWEMNLWGSRIWAGKKAGSTFRASVEDYRALRLSLTAMTAETYYRLIALRNELLIVTRTVESRKESLRMAKLRFEGGLTSETVYQQAMVEYSSAASRLPDLRKRLTATRNALTLLMGRNPQDTLLQEGDYLTPIPDYKLPVGVPSELLERRPDVRASRLRLEAATANVGYSYAERFPSLKFGFTPGLENDELKKFLQSPFTFLSGSIAGPIIDFGKKKRQYKAAVAAYEQNRRQYEKTVIQAFTEVNTAIETYREAHESSYLKNELCLAAAKYIQLAQLQYRAGSLNYIDVLDAQRRYFEAQTDVNNAVRDEYIALIGLYKALGGGWEP